mmetsp:Transcript_24981/g.60104  ORF Transcript_24981/g.60104 Transcript_24981/m.60104 type:complete len:319 (+) Transcript_24981:848-1804(+)
MDVLKLLLLGGEVERGEVRAGAALDRSESALGARLQDLRPQRFRESSNRVAEVPLEELDDRCWEGQVLRLSQDVGFRLEPVLDHEQGEVADDLGGRGDLHDVTEHEVGTPVGLLNEWPLVRLAHGEGLEVKVGVLPSRDLVLVHVGAAGLHRRCALERRVLRADALPVFAQGRDPVVVDACADPFGRERGVERAHTGLRGHPGHGVDGGVDGVCAGPDGLEHGGHAVPGRVVGVDMDREVGELLADPADEHGRGLGLEQAGHILDREDVRPGVHELLGEAEVVVHCVLGGVGVRDVPGVGDRGLDDPTGRAHRVHPEP